MKKLFFILCIFLLPSLALAQPSGEIDPYSIHWDASSHATTASIPFALGLTAGSTVFDANTTTSSVGIGQAGSSTASLGITSTLKNAEYIIHTLSSAPVANNSTLLIEPTWNWSGANSSTQRGIYLNLLDSHIVSSGAADVNRAFDLNYQRSAAQSLIAAVEVTALRATSSDTGTYNRTAGNQTITNTGLLFSSSASPTYNDSTGTRTLTYNSTGIKASASALTTTLTAGAGINLNLRGLQVLQVQGNTTAGVTTTLYGIDITGPTAGHVGYGINIGAVDTSTTAIGLQIAKPLTATTKYEVALDGTGTGSGVYFNTPTRAGLEYIRSTGTGFLNLGAGTSIKLDPLTTNGLVKTGSGDGTLSIATAGTDYVHTLSVTSPILNSGTAADPNIALDETASYSWSGQHTWLSPGDITLKEDVKFYIGDNNSGLGRLSLQYNSGTSQVELADEDSYIGNGGKFSIQPNILVDPNLNGYSQFGATPQLVAPSNSNDTLVVGRSYDGVVTGGKRAGFFESYYTGSTSHAGFNAGLNSFASTTSGSSGNLTASTQSGGLSGGRYRTAHAGLGLVSLSTGISILTSWTGSGNTTEAIGLQIETPTKTLLGGPVNWYGIKLPDMSGGAIASTATYGIYVQPIKSNYPVWFASNAEAFFREAGNKIYSSGAAALDVVATTTLNATAGTTVNLQAGGTTPLTIQAASLTLKDGVNFVGNTGTGNKIGTSTTQKWSVFNATPVAQQTATTDLGTALSNFGIRAAGTAYPITTSGNILFNGGTFEIRKDVPLIQLTDTTTGSSDDYSIDVGGAAVSRFRIRNTTDATTAFDVDGTNRIAMSTSYAPQAAYKVYVQDRNTAAAPAANYAALSSSFEYLPSATTTTMGSNLHGYQGGVTAYASNGNISGGGAFFGLRGDATVFLGNATTQSNSAVGLFASYAQSQLSGTGGTAAQGSGMATFLSVGANSTLTAGYHIRVGSTSNSGTITTLYGIYIPAITSGSTNYELFLDTNARAYFRDGNQYLYSSAASTLDVSANTTYNMRIGGTIVNAITSSGETTTGTFTSSRTTDIGWTWQAAPNQACNTTCVSACGGGIDIDAGFVAAAFVSCSTATADVCLCIGSS